MNRDTSAMRRDYQARGLDETDVAADPIVQFGNWFADARADNPGEANAMTLYKGSGCERCSHTGYKGRIGLFEVMQVDEDIRDLVLSGASAFELRQKSLENGMISLRHSGLEKIRQGMTSVEEVMRETLEL